MQAESRANLILGRAHASAASINEPRDRLSRTVGNLSSEIRALCAELAGFDDEPCGYRIEVLGLECTAYLSAGNLTHVTLCGRDISDLVREAGEWWTAEAAAQAEQERQSERMRDEMEAAA